MKIYKLLFLVLTFAGVNSCAEYVGNEDEGGFDDDDPRFEFVAKLVDNDAKYVGDKFEFIALLNGANVTSTTSFRVIGEDITGNTYIPFKDGEHTVIATKDEHVTNFKFNVLPLPGGGAGNGN